MGSGNIIPLAIAKYGLENFHKEILHVFSDSKSMYDKERELVDLTDPLIYNLIAGGLGNVKGVKMPTEGVERMRQSKKGKPMHPNTRAAIRKSRLGVKDSPETIKKKSVARSGSGSSTYGKPLPQATKDKISLSMSKHNHPLWGTTCSESTKAKISLTKLKKKMIIEDNPVKPALLLIPMKE